MNSRQSAVKVRGKGVNRIPGELVCIVQDWGGYANRMGLSTHSDTIIHEKAGSHIHMWEFRPGGLALGQVGPEKAGSHIHMWEFTALKVLLVVLRTGLFKSRLRTAKRGGSRRRGEQLWYAISTTSHAMGPVITLANHLGPIIALANYLGPNLAKFTSLKVTTSVQNYTKATDIANLCCLKLLEIRRCQRHPHGPIYIRFRKAVVTCHVIRCQGVIERRQRVCGLVSGEIDGADVVLRSILHASE